MTSALELCPPVDLLADGPRFYVGWTSGYAIGRRTEGGGGRALGVTVCVQDRLYLGREVETFRSENYNAGTDDRDPFVLAAAQCERLNEWDTDPRGPAPTVANALRLVGEAASEPRPKGQPSPQLDRLKTLSREAGRRGARNSEIARAAGVLPGNANKWLHEARTG